MTATATQPERLIFFKPKKAEAFAPEVLKFIDVLVAEREGWGRVVIKHVSDDLITVTSWDDPND